MTSPIFEEILKNISTIQFYSIEEELRIHPKLLNERDEKGKTLLHHAAKVGNFKLVEALLGAGAEINEDKKSNTPIFYAIAAGNLRIVKLLLEHKKPALRSGNLFINAAEFGQLEVAQILFPSLIKEGNSKIYIPDAFIKAAAGGHLDIIKWLIAEVENSTIFKFRILALKAAASNEHLNVIQYLINLEKPEEQIEELQNLVRVSSHLPSVKWAVAQNSICFLPALLGAIRREQIETIEWLTNHNDIDIEDIKKGLQFAIEQQPLNKDVVTFLIRHPKIQNENDYAKNLKFYLKKAIKKNDLPFVLIILNADKNLLYYAVYKSLLRNKLDILQSLPIHDLSKTDFQGILDQTIKFISIQQLDWLIKFCSFPLAFIERALDRIENSIDKKEVLERIVFFSTLFPIIQWALTQDNTICTKKALINAAQRGDLETVDWLITHKSIDGWDLAIEYAASRKSFNEDILNLLINHPEIKREYANTSILSANLEKAINENLPLSVLIILCADTNLLLKAAITAVIANKLNIFQMLPITLSEKDLVHILNTCIKNDSIEQVEWLIKSFPFPPSSIHSAVTYMEKFKHRDKILDDLVSTSTSLPTIKWALSKNNNNLYVEDALRNAARRGDLEAVSWLIDNKEIEDWTIVFDISSSREFFNKDILTFLINHPGIKRQENYIAHLFSCLNKAIRENDWQSVLIIANADNFLLKHSVQSVLKTRKLDVLQSLPLSKLSARDLENLIINTINDDDLVEELQILIKSCSLTKEHFELLLYQTKGKKIHSLTCVELARREGMKNFIESRTFFLMFKDDFSLVIEHKKTSLQNLLPMLSAIQEHLLTHLGKIIWHYSCDEQESFYFNKSEFKNILFLCNQLQQSGTEDSKKEFEKLYADALKTGEVPDGSKLTPDYARLKLFVPPKSSNTSSATNSDIVRIHTR